MAAKPRLYFSICMVLSLFVIDLLILAFLNGGESLFVEAPDRLEPDRIESDRVKLPRRTLCLTLAMMYLVWFTENKSPEYISSLGRVIATEFK